MATNAQNPYLSFVGELAGDYFDARYGSSQPAAPQPDVAYETSPSAPETVSSGADGAYVNATQAAKYQTQIGGVTFDTRFLWVSGLALGSAVLLSALNR